MSAQRIDGKQIAEDVRSELKDEVDAMQAVPGLTVVLVGDDPASQTYVNMKAKACEKLGIRSDVIRMAEDTSEEVLLRQIRELNEDDRVHGILVQLPLPPQISENAVIDTIRPDKDVDGFHPVNVGRLMIGEPAYVPCTPHGIIEMIERTGTEISGKNAVIIGRSNIVGKPMAMLLMHRHATVTICHSRTKDMAAKAREADILVAAVGKAHMVTPDFVKPGAVVIDVGMNRLESGKLTGDVDFEAVKEKAGHLTPVPGGVGPMTITMLLKNTVDACKRLTGSA